MFLYQRRRRRIVSAGAPSNSAPNTPTISAGTPTSSGVTFTGSAFSDPDVGDTHAASQWQVTTSADTGYASPVISTGDDAVNLTSYAATGLDAATPYIARVRYKDSAGNYSAWSASASFTTAAANLVFDNAGEVSHNSGTVTIGTLTNGVLVCMLQNTGGAITSVNLDTAGGAAFTQLRAPTVGGGVSPMGVYVLYDPPAGAHGIFLSGSVVSCRAILSSWANRNTTTPVGTPVAQTGTNTPSVSVPSAVGDIIIDGVSYGSYTASAPAGQTSLAIDNTGKVASTYKAGAATSTTMGPWASIGATNNYVAVALKKP